MSRFSPIVYHRLALAGMIALVALGVAGCRSNPIFRTARVVSAVPRSTSSPDVVGLPTPPPSNRPPLARDPSLPPAPALLPQSATAAVALADAATLGTDAPRIYARFCRLCHGPEAKGYAADNAPSLVSSTFLESASAEFLVASIGRGRPGTAMAGYARAVGGPLDQVQLDALAAWLRRNAPPAVAEPALPTGGNAARGQAFFGIKCQKCHGTPAQRATALHGRVRPPH